MADTKLKTFLQRVSIKIADKIKKTIVLPSNEDIALAVIKSHLTHELVTVTMQEVCDRDAELAVIFKHNLEFRKALAQDLYRSLRG